MSPAQQKALIDRLVTQEFTKRRQIYETNCISAITAAFCITLHDKNSFGKKRLNKLIKQVTEQFMAIRDNFVTLEDFETWAKNFGIEDVNV